MKWITLNGRAKDISIKPYLVDWEGEQGSLFSAEVLDFLHPYWHCDVVVAEFPVAGTRMRFDYVNMNRKVVVECDGRQHTSYVPHLAGSRAGYLAQIKRDLLKDRVAELNGFKMVRIEPDDLPLTRAFFSQRFDILL